MDIIKCVVRGQRLSVNVPVMADLTVNYFNVMANFDSTWERYTIRYVHIHSVEDSSVGGDWLLDAENKVANTEGINLSAGEWEIWYHGAVLDDNDETVTRITTERKVIKVLPTGNAGGVMPQIPESNVEQITALAQEAVDIAQSVRDDADAGDFNGATFTPSVATNGDISWTNDKDLPNPTTRNIKGPKGDTGTGIPSGGTAGQAVVMGDNNETTWADVAPKNHASTATTYGKGNSSNYGHVKLSDATDSTSSTSGGTAATPKAVKDVMDAVSERVLKAGDTMTGDLEMKGTYTDTVAPQEAIETPKLTFVDTLGTLVGKLSMKFMTDGIQKLILLAKRGSAQNYLELGFDSDGNPIVNSNRKAAWRTMLGMDMFQISGNTSVTIPLAGAERAMLLSCAGVQSVTGIVLLYCANTSGNVYYYDLTNSLSSFTFTPATNSLTITNNYQYNVMLCKIKFSV